MTSRLLILLLLMNFRALSISPDRGVLPPYRQYTLRDGLSQMQVTELFQDSRGYLWTGTKSGLNCFNGERFTSYKVSNGKLSDDYIMTSPRMFPEESGPVPQPVSCASTEKK